MPGTSHLPPLAPRVHEHITCACTDTHTHITSPRAQYLIHLRLRGFPRNEGTEQRTPPLLTAMHYRQGLW